MCLSEAYLTPLHISVSPDREKWEFTNLLLQGSIKYTKFTYFLHMNVAIKLIALQQSSIS